MSGPSPYLGVSARVFAVVSIVASGAFAQCGGAWLSGDDQGIRGIRDTGGSGAAEVLAGTMWDPDGDGPATARIVIGGKFTMAGAAFARSVAAWDGEAWRAFGAGPWEDGWVNALSVHAGDLVACGLGNPTAPRLRAARWDGTAWQPIGAADLGSGQIRAAAVFDGELVVGGAFSSIGGTAASAIARWDGKAWRALGVGLTAAPGGATPVVYALEVFDGELVAAGSFGVAGGIASSNIARWDGGQWQPLGGGVTGPFGIGTVFDLAVHDGRLVAVGSFTMAGGVSVSGLARWDGVAWSALPGGAPPNGSARSVGVHAGDLVIGGSFTSISGAGNLNHVARWDGATWHPFGGGLGEPGGVPVHAIVSDGERLVVGGEFKTAGGVGVRDVALWQGGAWRALGAGMDQPVLALGVFAGDLVAGGRFTTAGDLPAALRIARRGNDGWRGFGVGVTAPVTSTEVLAVMEHDGELVAGGSFTAIDGVPAQRIARWNGASWQAMGGGFASGSVRALLAHQGVLFAAGDGGPGGPGVSRWTGKGWAPVGGSIGGTVEALVIFDGSLVAGGSGLSIGGAALGPVARWDGSTWAPLGPVGSGPGVGAVAALAVFAGELVATGSFGTIGGVTASRIAAWNGSSWRPLGPGLGSGSGTVGRSLAAYGGTLVVGGDFALPLGQGSFARNIARWDGAIWSPLGAGVAIGGTNAVSTGVHALAVFGDELAVGGNFLTAGDAVSAFWARWRDESLDPCRADLNGDGEVNAADLAILLGAWGACPSEGACPSDLTCDGAVNAADLAILLGGWGACGP